GSADVQDLRKQTILGFSGQESSLWSVGHDLSDPHAGLSRRKHSRLHFGQARTQKRGRISGRRRGLSGACRLMNIFRTLEFLALSIWLGSDVFLSFVVAPGAFSVLASRDQAGAIVGYSLTRVHWLGASCGVLILLFRFMRARSITSLGSAATLLIVLM